MTIGNRKATLALLPAALSLIGPALFSAPVLAQTGHPNNAIERHPTLTGIGAAIATHHALKVAARNRRRHGQRLNWAERHPTMSAIGVGAVTRHEIKKHTPHY